MKPQIQSLFFLFAVCQLTVAADIRAVVIDGNTANSCPSEEKRERAIQSLRSFTDNIVLNHWSPRTQCGEGFWYQLVGINMSTADSQCPAGWVEESGGGVRACGRGTVGASCHSVVFNNEYRIEYTKVCGRALGYQYGHTDAFGDRPSGGVTIDQTYVDGLSISYGSPRQHLWTFAAGQSEGLETASFNCPCSSNPGASPPSYVGNNWYCESGNPSSLFALNVYSNDPLWDGENCEGTCCSHGKSPPWFSVELPTPTSDYIEARICSDEDSDSREDVFIYIFEIYVQ